MHKANPDPEFLKRNRKYGWYIIVALVILMLLGIDGNPHASANTTLTGSCGSTVKYVSDGNDVVHRDIVQFTSGAVRLRYSARYRVCTDTVRVTRIHVSQYTYQTWGVSSTNWPGAWEHVDFHFRVTDNLGHTAYASYRTPGQQGSWTHYPTLRRQSRGHYPRICLHTKVEISYMVADIKSFWGCERLA